MVVRAIACFLCLIAVSPHARGAEPLCDLNKIIPSYGRFEVDSDGSVREVPTSPMLVECDCEFDQFLRDIADRDPGADARRSLKSGKPVFLAEPVLGGLWAVGLEDSELDLYASVPRRALPGLSEHALCYEQQRLSLKAREYLKIYNRALAGLLKAK